MGKEASGKPYPDMVKYMEGCWHCIHPDFLEHQLNESLKRLQVEKLDVFLLHNPEYYLTDALNKDPDKQVVQVRDIFNDRIKRAFRKLEDLVEAGKLSWYGVSSNTFGSGIHDRDETNVEAMWEIACKIGQEKNKSKYDHHFAVVQMPANLLETNPMLEQNCADSSKTPLEYAKDKELGVLINRPLNAVSGNKMIRLANLRTKKIDESPQRFGQKVMELEKEFVTAIGKSIDTQEGQVKPDKFFVWGKELQSANLKSIGLEQWKHLEYQVIRPQISHLCQALDQQIQGDLKATWENWRDRYVPQLIHLLEIVRAELSKHSQKEIKTIESNLNLLLPEAMRKAPLSQKALAVLIHTPGVSCVLNGMRRESYVEDAIAALKLAPIKVHSDFFKTLAGKH